MRLFLNYRQRNVQDRSAWEGILDNHFVFTLPITPYRSFLKRDVVSGSRMLVGIDAVIADVGSLHLMVESVGQGSKEWKQSVKRGEECLLEYSTNSNDFHFSGDKAMCKYTLRTVGFKEVGAVSGCEQHGMILCRFNPNSNKLVSVEMVFDVMAFMQQLQRAAAITPESSVIPNTVEMALQGSKEARAIMKSDPPFPVLHINAAWTELSGIPQSEAEDMPLSEVLRLMPSQFENLYALVAKCSAGQAGSAVLITHCAISPEQPALVYLKMLPLTSNTEATITHFLGIHTDLPLSVVEKKALLLHCKSTAQNVVFPSSSGAALGVISVPQEFHQAKPMPIMFSGSDNRFHDLKKADEFSAESSSSERISGGSSSKKSSNFAHSDLPSNFHGVHASRGSRASSEGSSGNAHSFFDTNAQSERVGKFSGLGKDPSPPLRYPVLQNMSGPRKPRIKQEGSSNSSASSSGGEPTVNSRKRFKSDRYNIDPSSHA